MGFKSKLGIGLASAVLGLGLIGGGTVAYFSDEAEFGGSVEAGELELNIKGDTEYSFEDIKPGDETTLNLELENDGEIDVSKLTFEGGVGTNGSPGKALKDYLKIKKIEVDEKEVASNIPLSELDRDGTNVPGVSLDAGESVEADFYVEFEENGEEQNDAKGGQVNTKFTIEGQQ